MASTARPQTPTGPDFTAAFTARQYLLVALVADAGYDDTGLNEFLREARKLADQ